MSRGKRGVAEALLERLEAIQRDRIVPRAVVIQSRSHQSTARLAHQILAGVREHSGSSVDVGRGEDSSNPDAGLVAESSDDGSGFLWWHIRCDRDDVAQPLGLLELLRSQMDTDELGHAGPAQEGPHRADHGWEEEPTPDRERIAGDPVVRGLESEAESVRQLLDSHQVPPPGEPGFIASSAGGPGSGDDWGRVWDQLAEAGESDGGVPRPGAEAIHLQMARLLRPGRPVIVIVEDMQWMREDLAVLLARLSLPFAGLPVLVVGIAVGSSAERGDLFNRWLERSQWLGQSTRGAGGAGRGLVEVWQAPETGSVSGGSGPETRVRFRERSQPASGSGVASGKPDPDEPPALGTAAGSGGMCAADDQRWLLMEHEPGIGEEGSWSASADFPGLKAIAILSENRVGRGEDAYPFLRFDRETGRGLMSVCDGMGGSGSQPAWLVAGQVWTHARVAAHITETAFADQISQRYFEATPQRGAEISFEADMTTMLREALSGALEDLLPANPRIRGSAFVDLPATLAAVTFTRGTGGTVEGSAMWAGDSRAYLLTRTGGLQQLTRDDSKAVDALEALVADPPMTNSLEASGDFRISSQPFSAQEPAIVLAATDGAFAYLRTPADLELILLETLMGSETMRDWAASVKEALCSRALDDVSLVGIIFGFDLYEQLRESFVGRLRALREIVRPLDKLVVDHGGDEGMARRDPRWNEARRLTWNRYRTGYEKLIPELGGVTEPTDVAGGGR